MSLVNHALSKIHCLHVNVCVLSHTHLRRKRKTEERRVCTRRSETTHPIQLTITSRNEILHPLCTRPLNLELTVLVV
jgi:hypothetical protein